MKTDLEIHLLGGMQIQINKTPVTGFISSKVPALLVYLAVNQRAHQRESLASLLWGEMPDADARNNLRQALSNLRKFFGPYLKIANDTVQFNAEMLYALDVEQFGAAFESGDFERAIAIYRGNFLEGFVIREAPLFEEWVFMQQARLHEQALEALHRLMTAHANCGEYGPAMNYANRLLALDPWREEIHRQLMLMQARSGQRSAALAQYNACRTMLRKEFDVEPSTETTALYERIKESLKNVRSNLPAAVTGFVGRESELAQLRQMMASPEIRLVTILGPGGVGKTRLALETAASCEAMFLNGVWFASPGNEQSAGNHRLLLTLANVLGCMLTSPHEPTRELIHFLRPKELLLVVDELEDHLEGVGLLAELLAQVPDLKILATSRQRLGLQAEHVFRLDGLPVPPVAQKNQEPYAAQQLFLQRARRAQANFNLSHADEPEIAKICQLVGGMPLGIELAAAWVNQVACSEIASQIESSIDFLQTSFRDASPRRSNLRGVFEWSWNHLTPAEQTVFQRLSVFSGPFSREAALQVAGSTPANLAALVEKSLVWQSEGRYYLHQVARQFGAEKLRQNGDGEQISMHHAEYYARFLARQGDMAQGSGSIQQEALREIEGELENIRAAWNWMVNRRDISLLAAAIDGLYHFTAVRSRFRLALEMFGTARLALQPCTTGDLQARFTYCRLAAREGRFLSFLSRFDEANRWLLESLALLKEMNEPDELAFVLGHLGGTARMQGDLEQARDWLRQCLSLRKQTGHLSGQAVALLELAGVAFTAADFEAAREACQEGLVIAEKIGDQQTVAHLLTGLSLCYRELGQRQIALNYCQRSQEIYEALGDQYGVVQASLTQGELNRQLGKYAEAQSFCQQAIRISQEIGHSSGEADGHYRLGQIALSVGDRALALHHQYTGLKLAFALQENPLALDCLYEIGTIFARFGPQAEASVILNWLNERAETGSPRRKKISEFLAEIPPTQTIAIAPAGRSLTQEEIVHLVEANLNQTHES
ncbi:MAG: tetratricopeptide repeat protein [Anaerolineae bacterium]|nr:tetratricopeptide repeat protein [Anaerolineae bacterium]